MTGPELDAFSRGYAYGIENTIAATDALLVLASSVVASLSVAGQAEEMIEADLVVRNVCAELRRLREEGAERMIELWGLEP